MAQGGPVKMIPEVLPVETDEPMTCKDGVIQLDKEFCANNKDTCSEFLQNCYQTVGTASAANHHCNAAMVFLIFSCK